ncbi:hypothetical protein EG329_001452 [Mollisiaceae sp. DMI_Dod_QoI]|nr:hypothetical protein EG329_001452 [Helotiales sp. DMI_Dod_QoI]
MAPTTYRPMPTKSESSTVTFIGTGDNGATLAGGPVVKRQEPSKGASPDKLAAEKDHDNRGIDIQGDVIKSAVVARNVDNTESLTFKGKIAGSEKKPKAVDKPIKLSTGVAIADITVAHDVRMSLVCQSMTTKGISFWGDE